ncbi:MAG: HAD-IIIA family hydrolase [Pedobacter sp.]|nr:MAG: HAD-IIIA family hydrolase [Pedobacter sp.]
MLDRFKHIHTFIFDVDGVFTDGQVIAHPDGELLRSFNIKDGYALQLAVKKGYHVAIISGSKGLSIEKRFANLGVKDVYLSVGNKVEIMQSYLQQHNLSLEGVLYMGDDIPDLEAMKLVGLPTCPCDAVPEIKAISSYISSETGGKCAVRDVIEKVLKLQGNWFDPNPKASDSGQ